MVILALIHGDEARAGVFREVVEEQGHRLEEWSLAWSEPPPRPLDDYGAVLVFGGAMHADQDDRHPWLREENLFLQRVLDLGLPALGVCLGAQLIAKAAGAPVGPSREPEIGWFGVELTSSADEDPVFAALPRVFEAFQWHYYTYGLPGGAVELARSAVCTQAFRLGERVWGVQFHPEVTLEQVERWISEDGGEVPGPRGELLGQARERIADWNAFGRGLCRAFVELAERVEAPTRVAAPTAPK